MKYAKKLQHQLDHSLPEWKPNFICYKQLKKRLKQWGTTAPMTFLKAILDDDKTIDENFLIPVTDELSDGDEQRDAGGIKTKTDDGLLFEDIKKRKREDCTVDDLSFDGDEPTDREMQKHCDLLFKVNVGAEGFPYSHEQDKSPKRLSGKDENFLRLVMAELHKFNAFFLEKEEMFLIRLSILEERTKELKEKNVQRGGLCDRWTYEELILLHKQVVSLHGEMVLLMNYSSLNYVGLVKILKKYDKHFKTNLRGLVRGSVQQQPFFNLTNLNAMVVRCLACEDSLGAVFPTVDVVVEPIGAGVPRDVSPNDISLSEPIPRHIRAALRTMQEIQ